MIRRAWNIIELAAIGFLLITFYLLYVSNPSGALLIILSLSILSFFYMGSSMYIMVASFLKGGRVPAMLELLIYSVVGFSLIGVLFKIQIWPGSKTMLIISAVSYMVCLLAFAIWVVYNKQLGIDTRKNKRSQRFFKRLAIYGLMTLYFLQISYFDLYTQIGAFKNDPMAMEILANCGKEVSECKEFQTYIQTKIQERYDNTGGSESD